MKKFLFVRSCFLQKIFIFFCVFLSISSFAQPFEDNDWLRADSIVKLLTLDEKVALLHGNSMFTSTGIPRLGFPEIKTTDGPTGIREEMYRDSWQPQQLTTDSATFFPIGTALAATWNYDMALLYGTAIGSEARSRGKDILLGPGVNIIRTPLCGRTFEYFSEDPWLGSRITVGYIRGVQSNDVAACVKHFALNNQETHRGEISVTLSERALREIYLPSFEAAVKEANVYSVMAAYNKINGWWCSENDYLLNKILKQEWGFKGVVMSDWGGTHSTMGAALNGLDLEMATSKECNEFYMANPLLDSIKAGKVPLNIINQKAQCIVWLMLKCKTTDKSRKHGELATSEHFNAAYQIASQSIVLLKNKRNILPLNISKIKKIAVIGINATQKNAEVKFGAGVKTNYEITSLEGIRKRFGNNVEINYAPGCFAFFLPDSTVRRHAVFPTSAPDKKLIDEAAALAHKSDIAIVFVGTSHLIEAEALDRKNISLPFGQDSLIKAVCSANRNTIVVVIAAGAVDLTTANTYAPSIVWAWYNGSEGGNALADMLLGKVNPSGKMPYTIPKKIDDIAAHALNAFPGENLKVHYSEGILVGYRWFDTKKIKPLFPFGYGLSYTTFDYLSIRTDTSTYQSGDSIKIAGTIKNSGKYDGYETIELYSSKKDAEILMPEKELRAFTKVWIKAGETKEVNLTVPVSHLAYFNEKTMKWEILTGNYSLRAGSSSADLPLKCAIFIK